jgi:hypothetical protein
MSLSNQQIERYARQIIVPGLGGIAQERLISAGMMLAGKPGEVASVLAYMVGAGVGDIRLRITSTDEAQQDLLIMRSRQLNPEVTVRPEPEKIDGLNLILAVSEDSASWESLLPLRLLDTAVPLIWVRVDEPASVAIYPTRPPCPLCADTDLIGPSKGRSENAGFVAMVAATEAFKLLACPDPSVTPTLLQFSGFACTARRLHQSRAGARCACPVSAKSD